MDRINGASTGDAGRSQSASFDSFLQGAGGPQKASRNAQSMATGATGDAGTTAQKSAQPLDINAALSSIIQAIESLISQIRSLISSLGSGGEGGAAGGAGAGTGGAGETSAPSGQGGEGPTQSIGEIAAGNEDFEILTAALQATGLDGAVTELGDNDLTVLAPTDDAFRALASETLGLDIEGKSDSEVAGMLVETLGEETLAEVLQYHVVPGGASRSGLEAQGTVETLLGPTIDIQGNELVDNDPDVANPRFIDGLTDIGATNGSVQAIDRVLLPTDI